MPLYQYVKALPVVYRVPKNRPVALSFFLMSFGGGILFWVLWPILSFALISNNSFSHIITPISDIGSVAYAASPSDTLNANIWYPTVPQKRVASQVNTYTLSIPKLKIHDALATISGDDLKSSLVHYGGTGLPGQYGTAVVFGHSALPQFYQPTNYKTIFSLLPTLKVGDEIFVTYDGVTYTYTVFEMIVLEPTDLSTLEQRFDDSYLTLVTCVPPGTLWKRLNVMAKLKTT